MERINHPRRAAGGGGASFPPRSTSTCRPGGHARALVAVVNEVPIYVDKTLDRPHRPDDEYTYWSN